MKRKYTISRGYPGTFSGEKLKAARLAAGITQEQLASMTGIERVHIIKYEKGAIKHPYLDTVRAFALALNVEISALLEADIIPDLPNTA